jgi:alanine dehydrogenase
MAELRILSEQTVKRCLDDEIDACFEVCAKAYRYYGRVGSVLSEPSSLYLELPSDQPKKCRLKGAHFGDIGVAGFRLASPGSYFTWVVNSQTGQPEGLVAENWLHRRRTAVTGALTLRWLRPDLQVIALIGAGKIGFECAIALGHAFPEARIILGCRDEVRGGLFRESLPTFVASRMSIQAIEPAVRAAEAVLTITKASTAFIQGDWLRNGAVALSMGGVPEFDFTTWQRSQHFILDDLGYALKQGDLHHWVKSEGLSVDQIQARTTASIGDVALEPEKYQSMCDGVTLAVIQGMAVCDVAMAGLALERASALDVGRVVDLDSC